MNCTDVCQEGKTVAAALKAELLGDIPGIVRSVEELYRPGDNTRHFWQKMNNNILTRVKRFTSYVPLDDSPVLTKTFGLHRWGQVDCEPGHHDPSDAPSVAQANAVWRSLALLLRQREFVFGTLFAQKQVFPRIYGTCGPYYLQESCSSDQIHNEYSVREVFFGDTPIPWSTRATAALKVLQFLKHMHSQLPENLVLIDVQAGQFGVCADGKARVTDCDEARFKYSFGSSATVSGADLAGVLAGHRNSSSCETDLDCSVLVDDEHGNVCRTFCDVERKACFLHEGCTLQRVCFSVFRGWRALLRMADAGLLRHPPDSVAEELELAIQECERVTDTAKYDPEEWKFILERLVQLLRRSLA
ncbi:hypothetical protein BaRGS_00034924 [Batillaria attramentaria]|uniref:FAM69 protein-kinase domain-containing protein n=1 Tax=Batillaria attramentaria TaxID=370345 RepID=A0ABD0JG16_9CAEN